MKKAEGWIRRVEFVVVIVVVALVLIAYVVSRVRGLE